MNPRTPFFKSFIPFLGRRPAPSLQAMLTAVGSDSLFQVWNTVFGAKLVGEHFKPAETGPGSRRRTFDFATTFWTWLEQVLHPGASCRAALLRTFAAHGSDSEHDPLPDATDSAYIQARQRLPLDRLSGFRMDMVALLEAAAPAAPAWFGRRVCLVDGSSVSMPDTPANQKQWPQPSEQKPGCGFPVLTFVGLIDLETGAWMATATGGLRDRDSALLPELWDSLVRGDILLGDRGFCSYSTMAHLSDRGVDTIFRLHQRRSHDFRQGKHLAKNERLVTWVKPPQQPAGCPDAVYAALPEKFQVRLIRYRIHTAGSRTTEVYLATTLLDWKKYQARAIAALYFVRWEIELRFRELKTYQGMDVLRCKSPALIEKELVMHAIAYNLLRWLMARAGIAGGNPALRMSFKACLDAFPEHLSAMRGHPGKPRVQKRILLGLIAKIAGQVVPLRPGRSEPRAKKRRPKNYQLLTKPRHQMPDLPHRNRPTKKGNTSAFFLS